MDRISSGLYILYIFVYSGGIFFLFSFCYVPISLHCYSPHIPVSFAIFLAHCDFSGLIHDTGKSCSLYGMRL